MLPLPGSYIRVQPLLGSGGRGVTQAQTWSQGGVMAPARGPSGPALLPILPEAFSGIRVFLSLRVAIF